MAHHSDYDGAYFTIQALKIYHPEILEHAELLVVDNSPKNEHGELLETLLNNKSKDNFAKVTYVPFEESIGTAQTRNKIFEEASGKYVVCMDCHVFLPQGALSELINYFENNDTDDLITGPLLRDDLSKISTHFNPVWRNKMWGTWGNAWITKEGIPFQMENQPSNEGVNVAFIGINDQKQVFPNFKSTTNTEDAPGSGGWFDYLIEKAAKKIDVNCDQSYEVPAQGLGFFASKKEAWLGFNEHFRSFGGEECYIHEKYRQAGKKTISLPFLKWCHRFGRPNGIPYPIDTYSRCRNYLIGFKELGLDIEPIKKHFLDIDFKDQKNMRSSLVYDFSKDETEVSDMSDTEVIRSLYEIKMRKSRWNYLIQDPINHDTPDQHSAEELYDTHVKSKKNDLAAHYPFLRIYAKGDTVDITRRSLSTIPLILGNSTKIRSYMYQADPIKVNTDKEYLVEQCDYAEALEKVGKCDTLVIQPEHSCPQFERDLLKLEKNVSDTLVIRESNEDNRPNVTQAIKNLVNTGDWHVKHYSKAAWGCTVLTREKPEIRKLAWKLEYDGVGTELKKLFSNMGIQPKPGCSCNARVTSLDGSGIQWAKDNIEEVVGWLESEAKNRPLMGVLFSKTIARTVINMAISKAEENKEKYVKENLS